MTLLHFSVWERVGVQKSVLVLTLATASAQLQVAEGQRRTFVCEGSHLFAGTARRLIDSGLDAGSEGSD